MINVKKVTKKLKRGRYCKFAVLALDENNVISTSRIIHIATKGSKKARNYRRAVVKKAILKKATSLTLGKALALKAVAKG